MANDLRYSIGHYTPSKDISSQQIESWLLDIKSLHKDLEDLTRPLGATQLNNSYRDGGWNIKQILQHLTDSHMHSYIRFKWTLTEDKPLIKAYFEDRWAELNDIHYVTVEEILNELRIIQNRLSRVIESLNPGDFKKTFIHSETNKSISLANMVGMYAWHGKHHMEHIRIAINNPVAAYKPVSCGFYDELVLLAIQKTPVTLIDKGENSDPVIIEDIITSKKEEFLILSDGLKIRLDQIFKLENNNLYLREQ